MPAYDSFCLRKKKVCPYRVDWQIKISYKGYLSTNVFKTLVIQKLFNTFVIQAIGAKQPKLIAVENHVKKKRKESSIRPKV